MPFTFSHPAVVLPFLKIRHGWVSMSGLIIGSIIPDFEYFIRMKATGRYGHTLEGVFLFDLPVAFLVAFLFHGLVKYPAINNTPNYFYKRLIALRDFDFLEHIKKHFIGFVFCLLIGIGSHILWDSFTHPKEYFTRNIDLLSGFISVAGFSISVSSLLQQISTILGASFIIYTFHRQPAQPHKNSPDFIFWIMTVVIACMIFATRAAFSFEYLADIGATFISSAIIGVIMSSMYMRFMSSN